MILLRKLLFKMIKINNTVLFVSSMLLIGLSTVLIVLVEPDTFPTFFDGFWWVMTTVTTVGYGDFSPVTVAGRMIAIVLYILGIGLIGVVIGKVVDGLSLFRKRRREGNIVYKGKSHYIILGWSKKAHYAVNEMLDTMEDTEIVIIDDLETAPLLEDTIHYIKGNASSRETLEKANVREAKAVLIFADDTLQDAQLIDGKTLLIASTVESMTKNVHTVVEVMEEQHIKNFEHASVDEFIFSNETISSLAVRSAFTKGVSGIYGQLMRRSHGDDLFHVPSQQHWDTYRKAFNELLEYGATLIADRQNLSINRMLDQPLPKEAELYVICDKETYQMIRKEMSS
ncbi:ion transporter [Pontibacillus yanchengensis]|uniref:Ion transporter n=2 Tax=Pontibacillus yanchengensis TaxID=462910 RepID=A0ACC7VEW0_9BACI|nr:potassium channel protein [Pontibacillus yanchengensis]MYL34057.1 ion transporter [Pontibacillus yanchengensis]MYL53145.1 ion transporter [Pontibacillus yanchengensis]